MGASRYQEIDPHYWRPYWCAATEFNSTAFRDCLDEGGYSFLTRRGVAVVAAGIAAVLAIVAAVVVAVVVVRRRRRRVADAG
jgi:ABC-type Fe3+ transport system permease subunit